MAVDQDFKVRFAQEQDISLILKFIKALADYEGLLDQVVATEDVLFDSLFVKRSAEVVIGEYQGEPVGFALFFHNFSTFLGKYGLYLEDLYIKPKMRGRGFGKRMFRYLGTVAKERGCDRIDWWCLNWNEPSIRFYKSIGAKPMDEWTVYRLTGDALDRLGDEV